MRGEGRKKTSSLSDKDIQSRRSKENQDVEI
jgi:hypothetical protein